MPTFLTYSLVHITELVFLPFLNSNSVQKWKKTKIYKSEYRAGNIMQWFCRAIKLCIISLKIYAAIMVKVSFEIKSNSLNKVKKKVLPVTRVTFFIVMRVIGNKQFLKVGLSNTSFFLNLLNFLNCYFDNYTRFLNSL